MLRIDRISPTLELLTIDRPPANAVTQDLIEAMADRIVTLAEEAEPPAIILTGAGDRFFCAGGDIGEVTARPDVAVPRMHIFHRLLVELENYRGPVVSAVNGYAVGAGMELVLHSDYVFASENAQFGFPEINHGLLPAAKGIRQSLARLGRRVTENMLYTGELIRAERAQAVGLVDELVAADQLQDRARLYAEKLRSKDQHLFAAIKRTLNDAPGMTDMQLAERTIGDLVDYLSRDETATARERFLARKAN